MTRILVVGGAGYIGSHVVKALGELGFQVVVYDNLSTGFRWAVPDGQLVVGDVGDGRFLGEVLAKFKPEAVLHFAAHIVVPESVQFPAKYYRNNTGGTLTLLEAMSSLGVRKLIFSSTAAVYGWAEKVPIPEDAPIKPINPYGWSKAMSEQMIFDLARTEQIEAVALRYFNVAGADPDGRLGEGKPDATHLITMATRTAVGLRPGLSVFGTDYPTPDGTCIRDYIHVSDLAQAHVNALDYLLEGGRSDVFNCGYSRGYSVLEVIQAVKRVTGVDFTVEYSDRRPGDPAALVAGCDKINQALGWRPKYDDLDYIIRTAWEWEQAGLRRSRAALSEAAATAEDASPGPGKTGETIK